MPRPAIAARYPTPEEVQQVMDDLRIIQDGGKVYVVVDPHEIVTYCFPIDPASFRAIDIRSIADHQTAFYEVFYGARETRALLLEEYAEEVEKHVAYVRANLEDMYSQLEMLDAFIAQADLAEATGNRDELLDQLQQNFGVILAIVMGIFSLGAERLFQVSQRLLPLSSQSLLQGLEADEKKVMLNLLTEYRESPLLNSIFEKLNSAEQKSLDTFAQHRKRNADLRDARAVDRLNQLNAACDRAYRRKFLKNRHLFLYISSARRSTTIFGLDAVKNALPLIDGKKFSFLRNGKQLFSYAVQKSAENDQEKSLHETIANLKLFKQLLAEVHALEQTYAAERQQECKRCILEGGEDESCRWFKLCSRVRQLDTSIVKRQSQIDNLGLLSRAQKYQDLMKAKAESKEQKNLLELFREVCKDSQIADYALDRMHLLHRLTVTQSEFAKMLPKGTESAPDKGELESPGKTSGRFQLPTQANISRPEYKRVVQLMLDAYSVNQTHASRLKLLDQAYEEYLTLDVTMKGASAEHELVRCFLFLSFFTEEGDRKAFDHAVTQLAVPQFEELRAEFYYLAFSAARRLHLFDQIDRFMQEATELFPTDPRFPYARSANAFSWLTAEEALEKAPYTLADIIQLTRDALALYERDIERYRQFVAGNYNNVAFFSAYDRQSPGFDLKLAREYLDKLVTILPRDQWTNDPEYFHTEAFVLLREFEESGPDAPANKRKELLKMALDAVSRADDINHSESYGDLKRKIKQEMRQLKPVMAQAGKALG